MLPISQVGGDITILFRFIEMGSISFADVLPNNFIIIVMIISDWNV